MDNSPVKWIDLKTTKTKADNIGFSLPLNQTPAHVPEFSFFVLAR
jgi:hypothetical protein